MVQCANFVQYGVLTLVGLALAAPVHADDPSNGLALRPIPPTKIAMAEAYNSAGGNKCQISDCVAIGTILDTSRIIFESAMTTTWVGDSSPASEAYVNARTRPSVVKTRLRTTLLSHPDRFPAICARIASLVSLYDPEKAASDDHFFAVGLLQMALLIDVRAQRHCLADALAALPHTTDSDELVTSARDFCERAQWQRTACKRITRQ
jgi:hypothetical protein